MADRYFKVTVAIEVAVLASSEKKAAARAHEIVVKQGFSPVDLLEVANRFATREPQLSLLPDEASCAAATADP